MNRLILLAAAVLLMGSYCVAQTTLATADIPFSFKAEGQTYPAGTYRFQLNSEETAIVISGFETKTSGIAQIVTRTAATEGKQGIVVFDVVGNDHLLSEIHVPGTDGFIIKAAATKHTHTSVKSKAR